MFRRSTRAGMAVAVSALVAVAVGVGSAIAGLNENLGTTSEASRFGMVDAGEYFTCAVNNGDILCWGRPSFNWSYFTPTVVSQSGTPFRPTVVRDLSVGGYYFEGTACAVVDNGTSLGEVWCWGNNYYGQFGNGTTDQSANEYNEPVRAFNNITGVTAVSVGGHHVCILTSSRGVQCAGENTSGQLGNASNLDSIVPVNVTATSAALSNVRAISAGGSTSCAVLLDGSTWCWGDSSYYQLGRGSTSSSNIAEQVFDYSNSSSVVVVGTSVCTFGTTGANCWGENTRPGFASSNTPRLGTGSVSSIEPYSAPVSVINWTPTALVSSVTHSCALRFDGEVWCWGDNSQGFLGDGTTIDSASAVKVNLPGPVDVITAGIAYTCAVDRVGQMWCWGDGDGGGLGNGFGGARSTPTLVAVRSTGWTYMSAPPTTTTTTTSTTTSTTSTTTSTTTTTTTVAPTTTTAPTTTSAPTSTSAPTTTAPNSPTTTVAGGPRSLPSVAMTQSRVISGSRTSVTHDGFIAGETVDVGIIDDRVLTTTSADAGGRATADIVLSGPVGQRIDLYMRGRTSGSGARQTVEIGGVIVTTGTEATPIGRLALVVLTTGVLVVLGRRRRLV